MIHTSISLVGFHGTLLGIDGHLKVDSMSTCLGTAVYALPLLGIDKVY